LQAGDLSAFFESRKGREFAVDPLYRQSAPADPDDLATSPVKFLSLEEFLMADWA